MTTTTPHQAAPTPAWLDLAAEAALLLALLLPFVWPFDPGPGAKVVSMLLASILWSVVLLTQAAGGRLRLPGVGGAALAALAALIAAQTLAGRLAYPSLGWDSVALLLGCVALAGVGRALASSRSWTQLACSALLAQGMAQVAIGVAQFGMWQWPDAAQWLSAHAAWVYQIISYPGDGRIYGNLRQPNHYASALALGAAGLAGLAPRLRPGWIWLACAGLSWGLEASGSRAAALHAVLIAAAVLVAVPRPWQSPRWRPLLALPLLFAAWLALQHAAQTMGWISGLDALTRTVDQPMNARGLIWRNAWQVFTLHPLTGWGWGQIGWALERASVAGRLHPLPLENIDNAHNLLLQLLTDTGAAGALMLTLFALAWVWKLAQPWRAGAAGLPARQAVLAPALIAGTLLLHSLLEYPLWYVYFLFAFAFALGWAEAAATTTDLGLTPLPRRARVLGVLVAACALALSVRATTDYLRTSQLFEGEFQQADRVLASDWFFAPLADFALASELTPTAADSPRTLRSKLAALDRASHAWGDPGLLERRMLLLLRLGRRHEALALADYCAHAFWLYAPQTRRDLSGLAARAGMADDPDLARIDAVLAAAPRLKRLQVQQRPSDSGQDDDKR